MSKQNDVKKAKKKKDRDEYLVSRPVSKTDYKIIQNVALDVEWTVTIEETPTRLAPGSEPVFIPVHEFNRYLRGNQCMKEGIIIELDEDGNKLVEDNPNIMLDSEIEELVRLSLEEFNGRLTEINSPTTLFRVLHFARKAGIGPGIASSAQHRYNDVALPKGEPVLDLDMFGRPRRVGE
jgi:hypothetical protein